MITFIELKGFASRRADFLDDDAFREMQEHLIENPEAGSTIANTGGFRKLRWARKGMGKSGGVRVIYYNLAARSGRIYLALIYPKNEQDNLTSDQEKVLKSVAAKLDQ